ncbi:MAG: outer membrane protein assembly factor BamD [Pseudomonadota bacterium]|nr:outer membrane protein assembly factor BamD [Pseudomonadota bacterium]
MTLTSFERLSTPRLRGVTWVVALATALAGCSTLEDFNPFAGERYKMEVEPVVPASQVYDQGLAKLANGDPTEAAKKFTDLGKKYPDSDWARKGLLMTTYAQYQAADYDGATGSAQRYVKQYPHSAEAPYALYLQANSHYAQIMDISRDQDHAAKALELFKQLVQTYPTSEYVADAKLKIQVTTDQLGGKEMSIGRFYLHRRNYTAAINRFRTVLTSYQTTRHSEEALYRLVECYMGLGITDEAETAAAILGHNFPDGQWYKDAFNLLKSGGRSPQEHPDSWIAKLYHSIVPT